ncbi:MAG: c-type cytochrome [Arcobacteraceae bacterium]|nr:c-type cytochrome [Arcobacteraceae bacterium]
MKKYILLISFLSFCYSQDAAQSISSQTNDNLFITNFEYGQMLYENPRGIGCIKCHGKNGKGKFIARYTHKDKEFEINAPAINTINLENFIQILKTKSSSKSIMPTYFLTNDEMKQIHFYITHKDK